MGGDIRDIQTLIEDAFVDIQRDDDCTLHQSQFSDTFGDFEISDEEWNRLRDAERFRDPETDWRKVPAASLDECDAALSHATPQCWCFYLPAYMRRALELLETDLWFPDSMVFHLTSAHDSRSHLLPRFTLLDAVQQNAIVAFLEYVRDHRRDKYRSQAAAEALTSYWALPVAKRPTDQILLLDGWPKGKSTPQ